MLNEFLSIWNGTLKNSDYSKAIVYHISGESVKSKLQVKWWTSYDQIHQLFRIFSTLPRIEKEIKDNGFAKANNVKLLDIVTRNKDVTSDLSLALCAVVDVYGPFVRVTRFLESCNFGP